MCPRFADLTLYEYTSTKEPRCAMHMDAQFAIIRVYFNQYGYLTIYIFEDNLSGLNAVMSEVFVFLRNAVDA